MQISTDKTWKFPPSINGIPKSDNDFVKISKAELAIPESLKSFILEVKDEISKHGNIAEQPNIAEDEEKLVT